MAINTATKRMSISQLGEGTPHFLQVADGAVSVKDRFIGLNLYSGIADTEVIAGGTNPLWWFIYCG